LYFTTIGGFSMRSRRHAPRARWIGAGILLALAAAPAAPRSAAAQPRPTRPHAPKYYAIRDARIVTVSGATIDRGTIVLTGGVIRAVGRNVPVPAEAWVIDGEGRTVYPGLVDAMTTLGHPSAGGGRGPGARAGASRGGRGSAAAGAPHSWGPEDRPATMSWVSAADDLDASDGRIEKWRNAGFTTVGSVLEPGLVTGQAAVLDLVAGEPPRRMVVTTPVAMRLRLRAPGFPGYPSSLMGSFAYLKQLYMDAAHYGRVWDAYNADPKGHPRPEWDRALEPIRRQLEEGWPVLFPGQDRKEIERAIRTSRDMGVMPIVYGAQGAYAAADLLAGAGASALVNVDWPHPAKDADPEAEPDLAMLRLWDRAPTTPAKLAEAGVRFAFYSGGLSAPDRILAGVRRAIALGLSEDDAIRALTLSAAEILGVSDRLGSIEAGKLANLVVTDGDLFATDSRVETVFVDGDEYHAPAAGETARGEKKAGPAKKAAEATKPIPMAADRGPYRDDPVTLIRDATILTASHGTIEHAAILIRNGKIAAVGGDVQAPRGARVVDAAGRYVTPGIIDAHSHIAADAINEGSVNVSAMVGIRDVLNPNDVSIYRALAGGVTSVNVLHGSANPIGGKNAVIKLTWGSDAAELLIPGAMPGIKFALGENTKRDRNPDRYPGTRMGVQDVIRQAFLDARAYRKKWDEWRVGGKKGVPPRRDLKLEALVEILEGKRWVHAHSYRADEILQLMRVAEEFGFRIRTFQHVLEGYKVADEIAAHGAGASTFSDWWAYKMEAYDAIPYNAALMTERGVLVSINSDSGEEMRHLNQEAAKTMK